MTSTTRPTAADITLDEFRDALDRYTEKIETVSASKSSMIFHLFPCIMSRILTSL